MPAGRRRVASSVAGSAYPSIAECCTSWARNEAGGTLAVTEFHNLIGLDCHLYCERRGARWTRLAPGKDVRVTYWRGYCSGWTR